MRLWIRADASPQIGLGHAMRSIAVAEQARQARIPAMFVLGDGSRSAQLEVRTRDFEVRFGAERERWIQDIGSSDIVIFDGYHFTPALMSRCRTRGCRVGAVDDFGNPSP